MNYIILIVSALVVHCWADEVTVSTEVGDVKGYSTQTKNEVTYYTFFGIPYAKPPVDDLRFQAPQPVEKWEGVLDATYFKNICYQVTYDTDSESEDCLFLNIFTPSVKCDSASLPVMVYIHGGGFIQGNGWVGPEFFMNEEDVILVTLNYRLGPFGFLSTGDSVIPGNAGLKDQAMALQWIHENIKNFCGNPDQVTIFGMNAGAASVSYHLLSPKSTGLFSGAISQSGSSLSPWAYQRDQTSITTSLAALVATSDDKPTESSDILSVLLAAEAKDIDSASNTISQQENARNLQIQEGYYFAPVIEAENDDAFLTTYQYETFKEGNINKVPTIIGITAEEFLGWTDLEGIKYFLQTFDSFYSLYAPRDLHSNSSARMSAGKAVKAYYDVSTAVEFNDAMYAKGVKYFSDTCFARASVKQAALQSAHSDVYFYVFSYDGVMGDRDVTLEGTGNVGHGEEGNYMFSAVLSNSQLDNTDSSQFPESDVLTQSRLIKLWTNFAKNRNPTPEAEELLGSLTWPKVDVSSSDDLQYFDINATLSIQTNPRGKETLTFWDQVYEDYGVEPYDTY